ncbi:MAG: hypothetical protein IJK89_09285 [Clostridia bacterium]|nr:hypothetical protein [Clostridia bacterium]
MDLGSLASSALSGVNALGRKTYAEPPEDGMFDYTPKAVSDRFTAGFGKAVMLPDDVAKKRYYIAGYRDNNPAKGVIDPQYAHALWLDDNSGKGGHLFISLDIVGLLRKDVQTLQRALKDFVRTTGCRSITVMSTHNHAGIDTMGIWGRLPHSGKNQKFMTILYNAAITAAVAAYRDRRKGRLYLGTVEVPDMQEDIRLPEVYSKTLTRLRFAPDDDTREIWFLNFASHSESLQGCNSLISADFPCYLRERIRNKTGAETIYGVGAIGGMISMKVENEDLLRKENRLLESTRNIGYKLADYAMSIKDEKELAPRISFIRQEFYCPVDNPVLTAACQLGILNADKFKLPYSERNALKTELSYYEIDTLKILMLPCELFPELAYGGYLGAEESALGEPPEINPPPLTEIAEAKDLLIFGLANDELGYVIPPNDFLLNESIPYMDKAIDRLGRRHYEETNSMGPETAGHIADALAKVMIFVKEAKANHKGEGK